MNDDPIHDDHSQATHHEQSMTSGMDPSSPRETDHRPPSGPGYGPPGYPTYQYPPAHYPPPTQGYGPPTGGAYPPPHYYPPQYGYGHPPPYGYPGYSGYPTQHSMAPKEPPRRLQLKSPVRKDLKPKAEITQQLQEDIEQERLRAAVEPIEVKPMKTDFHFFVQDIIDSIQQDAEKECGSYSNAKYLLHSNMNARLLKAWIETPEKKREMYFSKEEADRQRFMNDDEIASRHCATLTARAKSPRGDQMKQDGEADSDEDSKKREMQDSDDQESPTKKMKVDD
eukprot:CAMPEP_0202472268 /NCGR_PEP_ID=MMETSP1360-20130828/87214_1 /ASSEMBLY_ACC=CAM_ASM_000848 /TAXON_ID=515479 /ORGANISM="Licmophora paradoxa, Strain CCMP2313" /LENGTH=281 /DNA_ID=CAMNT_0049098681 /DNA_START=65 /DNA_END=910 /DNA_ORIENTATION=+